ncbi:hypothetical protein K492DRAFT_172753 [Lichtheimia hyalospora FSU 10163]|nr:hypothetical protein K492DRAFT_172753 [Lichtheimia hyalospora FSU 10163]
MDFIFGKNDRKRKADDVDEEEEVNEQQDTKKQLLDNNMGSVTEQPSEMQSSDNSQQQEQQPSTENDASNGSAEQQQQETTEDGNEQQESVEKENQGTESNDNVQDAQDVEQPSSQGNEQQTEEAATAITQTAASSKVQTVVPFDRLIVLTVSATCDENSTSIPGSIQVTKENSEVIELSFVIINASNMEVIHTEQIYVKPEHTPFTDYCAQVTGITNDKLESAGTLQDAINKLDDYIQKEIEGKLSFCFVTHGAWTLRIQLPREARDKGIELPSYLSFCRMFDLKQEIQRWQVHHREINLWSMSLKDLCETFHVERVTDQSAGLNTCLTTVNVIRYLTDFGHPDVFVHPIDTNADLQQFKKEESKVVHLAGLPFEVTQGELEAWFSSNGLRPVSTWMIQTSDYTKPNLSGFVVFSAHGDAMRALSLNGRCLGERAVEVSPSSERVIEAAGSMLVPFPSQPKNRTLRPGDWNCPTCGFHNFASRRTCFKCNTENPIAPPGSFQAAPMAAPPPPPPSMANAPTAAAAPPTMPTPPPPHHVPNFIQGDWMCPNYSCGFHNYASRFQCFKCGTYRPQNAGSPQPPPPGMGYAPRPPITFRPGDWYCPNCNFQNFASRTSCFKCHTPNPNPGAGRASYPPQAPPHQQGAYGYGGNTYGAPSYGQPAGGAGAYGYGPPSGTQAPFRPGDWYCPSCNSHNFASRFQCLKCTTPKPHNGQGPQPTYGGTGNPGMKPGDWICVNETCGFHSKWYS